MKRILFVDDERAILDGLRDLLRKQRKAWKMVFAQGGEAALRELERDRFDVVVSDMRMPGIDGVALLQKVKERHAATARIILSGHAERDAVVAALPVAHQFLSKPCDAEVLRNVVNRACGLQALLCDENLRSVIGKVDRLPSVLDTCQAFTQAAGDPDLGVDQLAKIVEQDPALSAKVLQLVNSSYFGLAQRHASVQQAVSYLGMELLKGLAPTDHAFMAPPVPGFSLNALHDHSLLAARIARRLFSDKERASEAFTAALVHDVGKIVLAMSVPDRFSEVLSAATETSTATHAMEAELLGVTHAEVGAYLLGLWGLPPAIVEAVAYHHHPELGVPTDTLVAVHVANALSHQDAGGDPSSEERLDLAFVQGSGFGAELASWRAVADAEISAAGGEH